MSFGELAEAASKLEIPKEVTLKPKSDFSIIGKSAPNPDSDSILSGTAVYGLDVRMPNMLYASMEKCTVYGATVESFDEVAASAMWSMYLVPGWKGGRILFTPGFLHRKASINHY